MSARTPRSGPEFRPQRPHTVFATGVLLAGLALTPAHALAQTTESAPAAPPAAEHPAERNRAPIGLSLGFHFDVLSSVSSPYTQMIHAFTNDGALVRGGLVVSVRKTLGHVVELGGALALSGANSVDWGREPAISVQHFSLTSVIPALSLHFQTPRSGPGPVGVFLAMDLEPGLGVLVTDGTPAVALRASGNVFFGFGGDRWRCVFGVRGDILWSGALSAAGPDRVLAGPGGITGFEVVL